MAAFQTSCSFLATENVRGSLLDQSGIGVGVAKNVRFLALPVPLTTTFGVHNRQFVGGMGCSH